MPRTKVKPPILDVIDLPAFACVSGRIPVPLTQGAGVAWLDAEDHEAIVRDLGDVSWFVGRNSKGRTYVRLCNPNTGVQETVARIITGRLRQTCVAYVDEDIRDVMKPSLAELGLKIGGASVKAATVSKYHSNPSSRPTSSPADYFGDLLRDE